ncbi:hypothetical protein M427DRAFT_40308 [Gonapodya prolifera JEL478]|uniref:Uncharacterized protein n=1 Tax=Gonapodya prolifera (strain JEL478) TaxID=1344416 RepID=A0A139B0A6_GONPJ|nr:hypothetical protein M427DRAFT_40308 [Gonapodya prolifera JEL478]|eukprot:KXS22426.1 hypothetical protein M427DRAFT_40308 [Gonapodya prolifera JEL478]
MVLFEKIRPVAEIKLAELERQRERLIAHYDSTIRTAEAETSMLDKLKALHSGLSSAVFYDEPLHPSFDNLTNLLSRLQCGDATVSEKDLMRWMERMQKEIAKGRQRADYTRLFGRILTEWLDANSDDHEQANEWELEDLGNPDTERDKFMEKLELLTEPVPEGSYDLAVVDDMFSGMESQLATLRNSVASFFRNEAKSKVDSRELETSANAILGNNDLVGRQQRAVLQDIIDSDEIRNEYSGCITILLDRFSEWDWKRSDPKRMRVIRSRAGKHRAFLNEDVITALLLQIVGIRWSVSFHKSLETFWNSMSAEFTKNPTSGVKWNSINYSRSQKREALFLSAMPADSSRVVSGGYGRSGETSPRESLLQLVAVELQLVKQASAPNALNTVLACDIKDFGPSVPHPVLLKLLEKIGVPAPWIGFYEKFLTPTVLMGTTPQVLRRGLPAAHTLSHVGAELLLLGLDCAVLRASKGHVHLHRIMDDMYMWHHRPAVLNAAWQAANAYLKRCGLQMNGDKCGSVVIPGNNATTNSASPRTGGDLPAGPVRWGALTLRETGEWLPDETTVTRVQKALDQKLASSSTILGAVNAFNSAVRSLVKALGNPSIALGKNHLNGVIKVVVDVATKSGGSGGIIGFLKQKVTDKFLRDEPEGTLDLPDAWFHWPILAGGLALVCPQITLAALRDSDGWGTPVTQTFKLSLAYCSGAEVEKTSGENDWGESKWDAETEEGSDEGESEESVSGESGEDEDDEADAGIEDLQPWRPAVWECHSTGNHMYNAYSFLFNTLNVPPPKRTAHHNTMRTAFLARGGQVRGRGQATLTPQWDWVLATYGDDVMETFGSLAFAEARLIPVQLIAHLRGEGSREE